jgi:hypothetical protein
VAAADERLADRAAAAVDAAVAHVPSEWLGSAAESRRADFAAFLRDRLEVPRDFAAEAEHARAGVAEGARG